MSMKYKEAVETCLDCFSVPSYSLLWLAQIVIDC